MNFLNDYPKARKVLYFVQWVANGLFAVLGAYFTLNGTAVADLPKWYVIPLGIAPVLWTYLGLQAGANTPSNVVPPPYEGRHMNEHGYAILGAIGLGCLVLALIFLILTLFNVVTFGWVPLIVLGVIGLVLLWVDRGAGTRRGVV